MKAVNVLEKMIEKVEGLNHKFCRRENSREFDCMKEDVASMLEEMAQLIHDDADSEEEETEEEEC